MSLSSRDKARCSTAAGCEHHDNDNPDLRNARLSQPPAANLLSVKKYSRVVQVQVLVLSDLSCHLLAASEKVLSVISISLSSVRLCVYEANDGMSNHWDSQYSVYVYGLGDARL
jgi:hypothetical protein